MKERRSANQKRNKLLAVLTIAFFLGGVLILWMASLRLPALEDLSVRKVDSAAKIYDRTGQILLYDMSPGVKQTTVPFEDISPWIKQATIAIEDKNFYHEGGVNVKSLLRAVLVDISTFSFSQGGSTITQQVVKNTILSKDKTPTRKLKEWILAIKLGKAIPKDQVLNLYLNETSYGGNLYGVEQASESFFGKSAANVDIAQAAYLAALPQAPSYYSPYGTHRTDLETRKNLVLKEMLLQGYINQDQYNQALAENVSFLPRANTGGIKAPHFVFFVIDYLAKKYGEDALQNGGLKVITTLDWPTEQAAEQAAAEYGKINQEKFNGNNDAIVAIDPKTGGILAMVGSRDYFDNAVEGNFNVALAHRQPGSAFKPFVYATLFNEGYTPDTILFDVPTQFSANCSPSDMTSDNGCYAPGNYDDSFLGPMTIRDALAQSRNIPAVKALYLAGISNSIDTATAMGVQSLGDPNRYGLTLVLGGGEVSLLDMTSAYGVFAYDGLRVPYTPIQQVQDAEGNVLEVSTPNPTRVLPEETSREINSILADPAARAPLYPQGSAASIPGVAVKTGTTNDYRDAWILGYTPDIVVGAWAGNNNNTPMVKKVSGLIVAPMWRAVMDKVLPDLPSDQFPAPDPVTPSKPALSGVWQTPQGVHTILYYVNKSNPLGPMPSNPASDPQYSNWEYGVQRWVSTHYVAPVSPSSPSVVTPSQVPNVQTPSVTIPSVPSQGDNTQTSPVTVPSNPQTTTP